MESSPLDRNPSAEAVRQAAIHQARAEAVADALLTGYAAVEVTRYPRAERSGTDLDLPVEALQVHASLIARHGVGNVLGLRPSADLAEAYGFGHTEADDLMLYMVRGDTVTGD